MPGNQHVKAGAPWVGEVSLLQNDHIILDMLVEEVYRHRRPCLRTSWTSLNRTVPRSSRGQEGHPVRPQFPARGRGCPTPKSLRCHPMLHLHVSCQQPKNHLLPALLALDLPPLPLPVQRPLSCNPSTVHRLRMCHRRLARATYHADFLPDISPQDHPVEQTNQGAKSSLEPLRVQRCDHVIVRIEGGILMSALLSAPTPIFRATHHH